MSEVIKVDFGTKAVMAHVEPGTYYVDPLMVPKVYENGTTTQSNDVEVYAGHMTLAQFAQQAVQVTYNPSELNYKLPRDEFNVHKDAYFAEHRAKYDVLLGFGSVGAYLVGFERGVLEKTHGTSGLTTPLIDQMNGVLDTAKEAHGTENGFVLSAWLKPLQPGQEAPKGALVCKVA